MNRTLVRRTAATTALLATTAGALLGLATGSSAAPGGKGKADLASVRAATAKYHDVSVALAAGYVPVSPCEELPGEGVMGQHYLHPGLAGDAVIDPLRPELLLYVPSANGPRLVGVEYFVAEAATGGQRPSVLDRPLDGPMPGHSPDMPSHYDLHLWLWKHNPSGMTAAWNPALSCAGGGA